MVELETAAPRRRRRCRVRRSRGGASRNASYANDLSGLGSGPTCRPVAEDDLNPLHPCGACKEWLYKIAEVNPGFKVVMFTDASCEEVFVKTVGQC